MGVLRPRRGDDGRPRGPRGPRAGPARDHAPRAGRGLHGGRPRPPDGPMCGRDGDARARGHEPRHRDRRRVPRSGADGRAHRADGDRQDAQGVAPVHRHPADARARHEVDDPRPARRRDPRDRRQGVPRRAAREARARRTSSCPEDVAATIVDDALAPLAPSRAYFPEPTDEAIAHAASLIAASTRPIVLAGNGVLRRHASPELRAFARGLHVPVAVTFMGKGAMDDRSHLSLMAVGPPGARPRAVGLRPGRPRDRGGLRPGRVRAGAMEPGRQDADRAHRHAAVRGGRRVPPRGGAHRRHRWLAAPPARGGPPARASAAGTPASGTRHARCSSTPTSARSCSATCGPTRPTTAGRSGRRRRSRTCAPCSRPTTSW